MRSLEIVSNVVYRPLRKLQKKEKNMNNHIWKAVVLSIVGLILPCQGLDCYICDDNDYDGEAVETCFNTVDGTTPSAPACPADAPTSIKYCRTHFVIKGGVVTEVSRGCMASDSDEDIHTYAVPTENKCTSAIDPFTSYLTSTTNCYYHCTTDKCNNITTSSLKRCSSDCNIGASPSQGSCNYLTGTCVCNIGWTGDNCSTVIEAKAYGHQRSCVQCNSDIDSGCISSNKSVPCPGSETYCSTTTSTVYDSEYSIIKSTVARGCTNAFKAVDQCSFNHIYLDPPISDSSVGYKEFNCFSTCDTDGCNTGTADGIINGSEEASLHCVVCSDTVGFGFCNPDMYGSTQRSACPSWSTHCKSTVTYLTSDKADLRYKATPGYHLVSVIRECSNSSEPTQCIESSVPGLSFKKITCVETCQEDGCNARWPARPKCITCSTHTGSAPTAYDTDGYDQCRENPPEAAPCPFPYHAQCVIHETGIQKTNVPGIPRRITRSCSYYNIGNGCSSTTIRNITIQTCNHTCTTDGCNLGAASPESLNAVVAAVVFNP